MEKTVDINGTTFKNTNSSIDYAYMKNEATFNYPIAIEFDIVGLGASNRLGIALNTSRWVFGGGELNLSVEDSVKLVYDGSTIKSYINGSSTVHSSVDQSALTNFKLSFYIRDLDNYLKIKNLKVYPI